MPKIWPGLGWPGACVASVHGGCERRSGVGGQGEPGRHLDGMLGVRATWSRPLRGSVSDPYLSYASRRRNLATFGEISRTYSEKETETSACMVAWADSCDAEGHPEWTNQQEPSAPCIRVQVKRDDGCCQLRGSSHTDQTREAQRSEGGRLGHFVRVSRLPLISFGQLGSGIAGAEPVHFHPTRVFAHGYDGSFFTRRRKHTPNA